MEVEYAVFSEKGVRRSNQDICRLIEMPDRNRILMVVCDGMSGHVMGEVAAETVCNAVCGFWEENPEYEDSVKKVKEACRHAADVLSQRSGSVRPIEMGTTLVMAAIEGNVLTVAHCGDSRCYLLRDGEVAHQTQDHADPYMGSERVLKCFFSTAPQVADPDVVRFEIRSGDRIFLCSDGVYKSMAPHVLTARLQDDKPLEQVVDVIKFMCEKFSTDNYTGILAKIL